MSASPECKTTSAMVATLFASRTQAHLFHLSIKGTGSYAAHKALEDYYNEIVGLVDGLAESVQGKYGLLDEYPRTTVPVNQEIPVDYFNWLAKYIESNRVASYKDSWVQNQIDTILELIYSTIYKLTNLR